MNGVRAPNASELVTVVIPAFNVEGKLEDAVRSVFRTGYPEIEIIIVEDGSNDSTLEVARNIRNAYPLDVTLVRHDNGKNKGAGASRNLGISSASGEFIAFLDADDWYYANRFETCIAILKHDWSVDAVYSAAQLVFDRGDTKKYEYGPCVQLPEADDESKSIFEQLLVATSCWHLNSIVIRKRFIIEKLGLFNEKLRLGQDLEFNLRGSLIGKFERDRTSMPVAAYRRHPENRYEGGFSWSWHRTCLEVYASTLRWMKLRQIEQAYIDLLEDWLRTTTFGRADLWLKKGRNDVARRLVFWLAVKYPRVVWSRQFWGNLRNTIW